eukprot:765278-Hanusia_phi.AAC.2
MYTVTIVAGPRSDPVGPCGRVHQCHPAPSAPGRAQSVTQAAERPGAGGASLEAWGPASRLGSLADRPGPTRRQ